MISDKSSLIHRSQRGLTLVELMIAIALFGIVAGAITMTFAHVLTASTRTSNHMTAVRQVQTAGYWVSRDALQAQPKPEFLADRFGEDSGFPLSLKWEALETEEVHEVVYTLEGGRLRRQYSVDSDILGDTIVAQYIDDSQTECYQDGSMLVLEVTATVGTGPQQASETRVYEITPRPGS